MDEKEIVLITGLFTALFGALKAYYEYKKTKDVNKIEKDEVKEIELDSMLEKLTKDFEAEKVLVLKLDANSKYAVNSKLVITHQIPNFEISQEDIDKLKAGQTLINLLEKGELAIQKVYEYPHKPFKEFLFKHAFISCYGFAANNKQYILFLLYRKETVLSKFDRNDIKEEFKKIVKNL